MTDCTNAMTTGELPLAALLTGARTTGGGSSGDAAQANALGFYAWSFGWLGCIDAPDTIPAGSVRPVFIEGQYEGNVCTSSMR